MPARRADNPRRWRRGAALMVAIAALSAAPLPAAPDDEAAARALVTRYFAAHNAHRLNEVLSLYSDNPSFTLSMGRGTVTGRPAIRKLELFDAMAGSVLHPVGATFERRDDGWHMHVPGVVESSGIFRAMGLQVVRTQAIRSTFIIREGRIAAVVQPEVLAPCARVMAQGLGKLTDWLKASDTPLGDLLLDNGRLKLEAANISETITAIEEWQGTTGWQPDPSEVAQCAGGDF